MIESSFIFEIEHGIQAFESYLISEYGRFATFPYLFFERAGLVYQLRVKEEGRMQELWCVRDDKAG